jgi:hypothetical protein
MVFAVLSVLSLRSTISSCVTYRRRGIGAGFWIASDYTESTESTEEKKSWAHTHHSPLHGGRCERRGCTSTRHPWFFSVLSVLSG